MRNIWYLENTQVYSKQKKWSWQDAIEYWNDVYFNKMKAVLPTESKIGSI